MGRGGESPVLKLPFFSKKESGVWERPGSRLRHTAGRVHSTRARGVLVSTRLLVRILGLNAHAAFIFEVINTQWGHLCP